MVNSLIDLIVIVMLDCVAPIGISLTMRIYKFICLLLHEELILEKYVLNYMAKIKAESFYTDITITSILFKTAL